MMSEEKVTTTKKVREVVGIFDDKDNLDGAIAELEVTAFSREMISILGTKEAIEKRFGAPEIKPEKAQNKEDVPRMPPVRPEEKGVGAGAAISGGIAAGMVGAVIAAGAAVTVPALVTAAAIGGGSGAILAKTLGDYFDEQVEKQINEGGLLLWVQIHSAEQEEKARAIMVKYGAEKIHVHEIT